MQRPVSSRMGDPKKLSVRLQLVLLIAALTVVGVVSRVRAEQLTGTVQYNGAMGPVSSSRPILLLLVESSAAAVVTTNGGTFTINGLAAGNYTLVYLLDVNNDGRLNVGEPALIYNNRSSLPGDPVTVPGPALTLQFNDDTLIPGISGTATYTGSKGTVNNITRIRVHAYTDPGLTTFSNLEGRAKENGGRYDVIAFDSSPLYLLAFLDLNGDDNFDSGEPFQIFNGKSATPGDPIVPGPDQGAVNFEFGDSTTSTCAGDCDNDTFVTVDELITLVDIALGSADINACLAGNTNHDTQITIDEILSAVNHALNGCGAT